MKFKTYKIQFKLVRSFSIGFSIYSLSLNGAYVEINIGCFVLAIWSRGKNIIGFNNYWKKQS